MRRMWFLRFTYWDFIPADVHGDVWATLTLNRGTNNWT